MPYAVLLYDSESGSEERAADREKLGNKTIDRKGSVEQVEERKEAARTSFQVVLNLL